MYALYIGIFISPVQILVELTEMIQKGLSGFRRFLAVVETEPEIVDAPDAKPLTDVKGDVSYENVSCQYELTVGSLDAETFRLGISSVFGRTYTFLMCH